MSAGSTPHRWLPASRWLLLVSALASAPAMAVVLHPGPLTGELATVRWLQDRTEPVPSIAETVWFVTGTEVNLIVAALPAVWVVRRWRRTGWAVVAIGVACLLVAQPTLKEVVDRPRLGAEQVDMRAEYDSASFPSGHSMSTTTVFATAALVSWSAGRRWWAVLAAVPIGHTALASGVQGVHWPTDAIGGTLVGAVVAGLMARLLLRRSADEDDESVSRRGRRAPRH